MISLKKINIKNKKVLIRVDYNVPIKDSTIQNTFRLKASVPTIEYCLSQNASIVLMTHLGRPVGFDNSFSVEPIVEFLEETFGVFVHYSDDCISDEAIKVSTTMLPKEIHLLENLRFHEGEIDNNLDFAEKLSKHADVYINDAFGTSHRSHASNSSILSFFKVSCFGFLMDKEITHLSIKPNNDNNILIVGGAKISTKINLINNFMDKVSHILIGGGMAFTFLKTKNIEVGKSLIEKKMLDIASQLLDEAKKNKVKIVLPVDVICSDSIDDDNISVDNINNIDINKMALDIGPETCMLFDMIIQNSKQTIWNGPMGAFENITFATGTQFIASAIISGTKNNNLISIIGGGDTVSAIENYCSLDSFTHVSTGGGASLKLLSGERLEIYKSWEKYAK